jgi:uncharacterized protein YndB with AHSA1/START domain
MAVSRPLAKTGPASLRVSVDLRPPPPKAWALLTEAQHISVWWSEHVQLKPEADGRFRDLHQAGEGWSLTVGRITRFDPPSILEMTWAEDSWPGDTRLAIHLAGSSSGTALVLTHTGWDAHPAAARAKLIEAYAKSWTEKLGLLAAYAADAP